MTTFQAFVFGVIQAFSQFLPVSADAHHRLVPFLLDWPKPEGVFLGMLSLSSLLALLISFRHDWASMISSFLQVVIFRRRPMTLDERMPFFLLVTTFPCVVGWYYLQSQGATPEISGTILQVAIAFTVMSLPLGIFDYLSRKKKAMYDWNWKDASWVGLTQATALIPGCDPLTGALFGALMLNYKREAAAKYALYAAMPLILGSTIANLGGLDFHAARPMADVSWLSFAVAFVVAFVFSLLVIGGFVKGVQRKGLGQYVVYRLLFGAVILGGTYWAGWGG